MELGKTDCNWKDIEPSIAYQVDCDQCSYVECFRTEYGALVAADLHEITHHKHKASVCEAYKEESE